MGIAEGMSRKPVPEEAVPVFKEDLSAQATILAPLPDLALLVLFAVATFMAAHLAFLRAEVA